MGLSAPPGLFNLSGLTNLGGGGPLVNLGAVPFGVGINGTAATAAVFAGSTGQALYIADTGAADPFRIRTGSFGCWMRTAKRGTAQSVLGKWSTPGRLTYLITVSATNALTLLISTDGTAYVTLNGTTDLVDDRWHFVVCTCDGTTARAYIDGALEAQLGGVGPLFPTSVAAFNVGANGADAATAAGSPFYGRIDEAFVTPDVLTDDQIRLLYASRLQHSLGAIPTSIRLAVHRRRKGAAFAVADFSTQPVRLHNFTGGALTDQGSGGVALTANPGTGSIVDVAGVDGTVTGAKSFSGVHAGLQATDAGLPGGLTTRSYGCWLKTTASGTVGLIGWGTLSTGDTRLWNNLGALTAANAGDSIAGPFIADGLWHFAVVVEDNTAADGVKRKLYCDGKLVAGSTVMTAVTLAGAGKFTIAASPGGASPIAGQFDGAFVCAYAMGQAEIQALYAKGTQDLGASPKDDGDHVERVDATTVLTVFDTLDSQHTVDLGVAA
jgi:hypothetical protein